MKRKLTVVALVMGMIIVTLTGCGGGKTTEVTFKVEDENGKKVENTVKETTDYKDTITVSEMLASCLEESETGEILIFSNKVKDLYDENAKMYAYCYGDNYWYQYEDDANKDLMFALVDFDMADSIIKDSPDYQLMQKGEYNLGATSLHLDEKEWGDTVERLFRNGGGSLYFGSDFKHIEIEGASYMCFIVDYPDESRSEYLLIQDTDYTKDKTVVFDTQEAIDSYNAEITVE